MPPIQKSGLRRCLLTICSKLALAPRLTCCQCFIVASLNQNYSVHLLAIYAFFFYTTLYDCILFYGPIVPEINSSSSSSEVSLSPSSAALNPPARKRGAPKEANWLLPRHLIPEGCV